MELGFFSASSELAEQFSASTSQLHETQGNHSWIPATDDQNQWISAYFGTYKLLSAVSTQGKDDIDYWVLEYKLSFSGDGTTWTYVLNDDGEEEIFEGNWDRLTAVTHELTPFIARFVRLHPYSWLNKIGLRWDVYGCEVEQASE